MAAKRFKQRSALARMSVITGMPVDLSGMTVNERLYEVGLIEAWDAAARARDRERLIAILAEIDVAPTTADSLLANPAKYGF